MPTYDLNVYILKNTEDKSKYNLHSHIYWILFLKYLLMGWKVSSNY